MMKRSLALSLALLYTVTVLGFAMNFHYCFNQVSGVTINQPVKMCVSQKLAKVPKCCKDKHVEIKVKDGHQSSVSTFLAQDLAFNLPYSNYAQLDAALATRLKTASFDRGPPVDLSSQPAIFLSNRNFRI